MLGHGDLALLRSRAISSPEAMEREAPASSGSASVILTWVSYSETVPHPCFDTPTCISDLGVSW